MPENINFTDKMSHYNRDDIVTHAIVSACVGLNDKDFESMHGKDVEVKLTFNGVEVPFVSFLKRFEECIDTSVETEAARLFAQKLNELDKQMEQFKKQMTKAMKDALPKQKHFEEEEW
ncbi:MAG: hypothetical protein JRZ94_05485 [Nitrososphaerota archaeon]|nr:hypothetical protein [Nitrososphaerota archaeon]